METIYTVQNFNGDYVALLTETGDIVPVAVALLPDNIEIGDKIKCSYFQYEKIN